MSDAALLDDLSGFEFEDVMVDVYRNLGFENVRQAAKVADKGRDVVMEEVIDGKRRAVIVECKHTDTVSRPVLQKLHSAVATYDFDGPKRGMVATTGRFTGPAVEYAESLRERDDPYPIELIDGGKLREIAAEVGLDLYNGRIEIICEETIRPTEPIGDLTKPLEVAFEDVENIGVGDLPEPTSTVSFQPVVRMLATIQSTFETSVGVIHHIDETDTVVLDALQGETAVLEESVCRLVDEGMRNAIELDEERFESIFDNVTVNRFGKTETEYKEWAISRFQARHTTTVRYTGDNNVTYTRTCEPNQSDIWVQGVDPVYLPEITHEVRLQEYSYAYTYYAAGPSRVTIDDGIRQCVQCHRSGADHTYTYCTNCGSINCRSHIETERVEQRPVCTGCAVTAEFFFATKYFYDESNLQSFREEYDEMPVYERAQENVPLVIAGVVMVLLVLLGLFTQVGAF